jgi:DNA-binding NtrC family response regulator
LVVDDHASARESVADVLRHARYDVSACGSGTEALQHLERHEVDVIVTDLQMPGMNGLELVQEVQRRRLPSEVVMITAHASIGTAVEAMRLGAFDYLEKPFDVTQLENCVGRACQRGALKTNSNARCGRSVGSTPVGEDLPQMIGSSTAIQELRQRIAQVSAADETVLIYGESGTGKELVAQTIHRLSGRRAGPMVSLNCPVLSAQLTESELFGHKRGAFTGAESDRVGRFELAHRGSILLDEVTEIDLGLQAKLLRVLQERSFEPVGSSDTITVDVRVLATSNRDLRAEVQAGRLREDLYYRLAVLPVELPPLRERGADVLELCEHYLNEAARRLNRPVSTLEPEAQELLLAYRWPGNVRELQNVITRACVLIQDRPILATDIRPWLRLPEGTGECHTRAATLPVGMSLEEVERQMIVATLDRFGGHRAKAAEALGIGLRTLSGKLRSYGYAPGEKNFAKAG